MGGRRPMRQTGPLGPRGEPLKFDGEFDFESANAQFEEIEKGLDKLKISSGKHSQNSNNDTSLTTSQSIQLSDLQDQHLMMKQKSMHSDSSDRDQPQKDSHGNNNNSDDKHFYDKNTSFFDRISCEANEKNPSKQKNWKEERKMNAETFGLMQRNLADKLNNRYNSSQSNYRQNNNNGGMNRNRNNYNNNGNNGSSMHQGRRDNNQNNQNNNNNQRYSTNQSRGIAVGGGSRHNQNNNNNRRNDLDSSYGNQRNGRRFGSR